MKFKKLSADIKYFKWCIKNWYRWKKNKILLLLFAYWILYPIPRLLFGKRGKEKIRTIFHNIISHFRDRELVIPFQLDSDTYYIGLRDLFDFDVFHENCIRDYYNYSLLKPGMSVVDVGAHIGTFTLLASGRVGERGKVISIEPEPRNFRQLEKNLKINEIKNVISINAALSDFSGKSTLFINKDNEGHSLLFNNSTVGQIEVGVKTLDVLLKELNISKVDFLKIDAEGVEMSIIKGAQKTLQDNPDVKMTIEAFHYPREELEVIEFLKKRNFSPKIDRDLITI